MNPTHRGRSETVRGPLLRPFSLRFIWTLAIVLPASLQLGLARLWPDSGVIDSPILLFVSVVVGASLCAIVSLMVLAQADATGQSELGYLGLFFFAMSILPLVHGIATPGVLYGANDAALSSAAWAIPVALLTSLPALLPRRWFSRNLEAYWRSWVSFGRAGVVVLAGCLLIWTSLLPVPVAGSTMTTAVAIASFVGCTILSLRHLKLASIARSTGPLAVATGYGVVGSSAFVWVGSTTFSTGFWVAHVLEIIGVFFGVIGALLAYRKTSSVQKVLGPILVVDPRSALELGLEPIVHTFISELETKDPITRDHVLRTTELAVVTGDRMGLDAEELRQLGLAALLHDIGKLNIPDVILNKPGSLTDAEYSIIKRHPVYGADLVSQTKILASIAPTIRAHHERIDGGGYPDGLIGSQIPLHARIVSVCDAFDAMAHTRQYREGMGLTRATEILQQHAGSQWDRRIVDLVIHIVRASPPTPIPEQLDRIGRIGCDCVPEAFADAA